MLARRLPNFHLLVESAESGLSFSLIMSLQVLGFEFGSGDIKHRGELSRSYASSICPALPLYRQFVRASRAFTMVSNDRIEADPTDYLQGVSEIDRAVDTT